MLLVFASDAKGPAEIAKPAEDGILIGVSRVSS
jgi:hypothetical protein